MFLCENCGQELQQGVSFCRQCGSPVSQTEAERDKKKRYIKWGGIGCGGLLLLFFVMGICGVIIESVSEPEEANGTDTVAPEPEVASAVVPLSCETSEVRTYLDTQQSYIADSKEQIRDLNLVVNTAISRKSANPNGVDLNHSYIRDLIKEKADAIKETQDKLKNYRGVPEGMLSLDEKMGVLANSINEYQDKTHKSFRARADDDHQGRIEHANAAAVASNEMQTLISSVNEDIRVMCETQQ